MRKQLYNIGFSFILAVMICLGISACSSPITKLPAPNGFELIGRTVIWDEVSDASGYIVAFEEKETETEKPRFVLSNSLEAGEYTIEVMALGDYETYADSEWMAFSFTIEEPTEHDFDDAGWEYTLTEDGQGYEISRGKIDLNGALEIPSYFKRLPVVTIADEAFVYQVGQTHPNPHTGAYCNIVTTGITIPDTVTKIGKQAFACISKLEQITIPDSVTEIGEWAFWGCTALKHVTLPKDLKEIPVSCFQDCALSEISFPVGLEEIGEKAFHSEYYSIGDNKRSDQSFTKIDIPNSVKRIGDSAFNGCLKLKEIKLPDALDFMGMNVFYETAWLDSQPDGFVTLGNILYGYKGDMTEGTKLSVPSGIRYLASRCFHRQKNLAEIVIPDGVKLIGEGIFGSCSSLEKIRLPADMTEIPAYTFSSCESLAEIEIPSGVTEIGSSAFSGCSALQEIALPNGLKSITGQYVFRNCKLLKEIVLPASLESLGAYPFVTCDNLSKIYYEGTEEAWKALKAQNNDVRVSWNGTTIPIPAKDAFSEATIYCFSEAQPQVAGNYWRYVNGVPTVWE